MKCPSSALAYALPLALSVHVTGALEVALSGGGYINVDTEQRTSESFVYAAGDCTRLLAHQIVTAAHEGATAAQTLNYDLLHEDELREETGAKYA